MTMKKKMQKIIGTMVMVKIGAWMMMRMMEPKIWKAPQFGAGCDVCKKIMGHGKHMWGCRQCDYDKCQWCHKKAIGEWDENDEKKGKGKGKKGKDKGKGKGKKGRRNKRQWWNSYEDPPDKFDDEHWEEPREETGLALIGEMAPKQYKWKYELYDESRRSYAGFLSCPFRKDQCETFFNNIKNGTDWLQPSGAGGIKVPRKTAWMVKKGCQCVYRYGSSEVPPQEYPPWMNEILRVVMPMCGCNNPEDWPDSCNMNLYEDGQMSVVWHADDEQL